MPEEATSRGSCARKGYLPQWPWFLTMLTHEVSPLVSLCQTCGRRARRAVPPMIGARPISLYLRPPRLLSSCYDHLPTPYSDAPRSKVQSYVSHDVYLMHPKCCHIRTRLAITRRTAVPSGAFKDFSDDISLPMSPIGLPKKVICSRAGSIVRPGVPPPKHKVARARASERKGFVDLRP